MQDNSDDSSRGRKGPWRFGNPRDVYLFAITDRPSIPDGCGRVCPQCGETTWLHTRWCWHCKYDFDRASVAKCHPAKLLAISLALNVLLGLAVVVLAATAYRR